MSSLRWVLLLVFCAAGVTTALAEDSATALARILAGKGVISNSELATVEAAAMDRRVDVLASLLEQKGVLSKAEVAQLTYRPAAAGSSQTQLASAKEALAAEKGPLPAQAPTHESAAPPVTTQSKFPVTIYGTLLTNAFFDTSANNIEDIPLFNSKQGSDQFGNDKSFGMTLRQSRFGMKYRGGKVGGADLSGQFEFDLLGGKAGFGNGINMDLFRLRLAFGRLDWQNFGFEAGQDWSIFAPLNPTSLAEFAIPSMSASGNPWIRMPQFRGEFKSAAGSAGKVLLQVAAIDPNMGDFTPTTSAARTPSAGERGRAPGVEARLAFTEKVDDRDFTIGFSSHYAHGKNAGTIGNTVVQTSLDSWGVALDWMLPFSKRFNLSGEAYDGRALGIFSVASGEAILPVGTPGQKGVISRGGWAQLQFDFTKKWQTNLAYGIDAPDVRDLRVGDRSRNQTYMANLMYKLSHNVTFAWEFRRMLTDFRNQRAANERGDQANMAVAYTF